MGTALNDASPYVRIVAAEALGLHGREEDLVAALNVLRELAPPEKNGVLVSMSALAAIEALGEKAVSLHDFIRNMNPAGSSPDARYNGYVPRQIQNITSPESDSASPRPKRSAR